jgi:hypothetical protein
MVVAVAHSAPVLPPCFAFVLSGKRWTHRDHQNCGEASEGGSPRALLRQRFRELIERRDIHGGTPPSHE